MEMLLEPSPAQMNGRWKRHSGREGGGGDTSTFALPRTRTLVLVKKRGGPIVHTSHGCWTKPGSQAYTSILDSVSWLRLHRTPLSCWKNTFKSELKFMWSISHLSGVDTSINRTDSRRKMCVNDESMNDLSLERTSAALHIFLIIDEEVNYE